MPAMPLTSPLLVQQGQTVVDVRKVTTWAPVTGDLTKVQCYIRGTPRNLIPEPVPAFFNAKQTDVNTSPFVK